MTAGFFFIIPQLGESENDICQSFGMNLHQRSKGAQKTAQDTYRRSHCPHLLQGDFLTDVLGFQDVIPYLCNHGRKVKGDAALEVQVEAAEINIGGADHRSGVVADKHLGMDKAGGVFKDAYPCAQQLLVVGAGKLI